MFRPLFLLFLFFPFLTLWAQEGFFDEPQLFNRQEVGLEGRLRDLILQDVSSSPGTEVIAVTRTGSYPDWKLRLAIYALEKSSLAKTSLSKLDLPEGIFSFAFSASQDSGWSTLYLFYPHHFEEWKFDSDKNSFSFSKKHQLESGFQSAQKGRVIPIEILDVDGKTLLPAAEGAFLFDTEKPGNSKTFQVPSQNFFRTGLNPLIFELQFWFRGATYLSRPYLGNFPGTKAPDLIWTWMDEFSFAPIDQSQKMETHFFKLLSEEERDDGQGYVVLQPLDLNGDGVTDFIVNKFKGAATALSAETYLFSTSSDGKIPLKGQVLAPQGNRAGGAFGIDLNRDGYPDLAAASAEFNVLSIVNALIRKKVTVTFSFYFNRSGRFQLEKPDFQRETSFSFDLKNAEIEGLLPSLRGDFNGDGFPDAFYARNRRQLTILIQDPESEKIFPSVPSSTYDVTVRRQVEIGDLNGDGLSDLVLYDKKSKKNRRLTVLVNTGLLAGNRSSNKTE